MFADYYHGKSVLVTGHTGFKGSWLCLWLKELGARVAGYGWPAPTNPSHYELIHQATFTQECNDDIRNLESLRRTLRETAPAVVFHLAAQPLVRRSYADPLDTFTINTVGTANVLEAVRQLELPCTVVVISSDKCYENQGWEFGYREIDPLGGHDVYSMSKGAAELVVQSWRRSFFLPNPKLGQVATARAGNVIGGGDYAEDRLVPDCIRSLIAGQSIAIRNPKATRPWQHVLDCLSGYLWLGARLAQAGRSSPLASAFNFGPGAQANQPVSTLVEGILKQWPGQWHLVNEGQAPHEAGRLNLSIDKAAHLLNWHPTWSLNEALEQTVRWYHHRHALNHPDMPGFSRSQIQAFAQTAQIKQIAWAQP